MITVEKCPCGHEACKDYHLKGLGKFVQGSGFTKSEAQMIADLFNMNEAADPEMMMVEKFHQKFGLPHSSEDILTNDGSITKFRTQFMHEEIQEFIDGYYRKNRVEMFDALLDLVYVAKGTALFMGITPAQWDHGMVAVQAANMSKVKSSADNPGKRHSPWDVVKPDGWEGPESKLKEILS